jgi:hypothetical protein
VRAGLAEKAEAWPWSSAAAHCGQAPADACLDLAIWRERWCARSWQSFLAEQETEAAITELRRCTYSGGSDTISVLETGFELRTRFDVCSRVASLHAFRAYADFQWQIKNRGAVGV